MNTIYIRPTIENDLPALYEMWYDKRVLDKVQLVPMVKQNWFTHYQRPQPQNLILLSAVSQDNLVGFLECDTILQAGLVLEFCIDSHLQGGHGGVGKALLEGLKTELRARNIPQIWRQFVVQPVEQAFWLSMGATRTEKGYYVVTV